MVFYKISEARAKEIADTEYNLLRYVFVSQNYATNDTHGYALPLVFQTLTKDDFTDKTNQALFIAMKSLFDQKEEINAAAVADEAGRMGIITQSKASDSLKRILDTALPTILGIDRAVESVKRNSVEMHALLAMNNAAGVLVKGEADSYAIPALTDQLLDIMNKANAPDLEKKSCVNQVASALEKIMKEFNMSEDEVRSALFPFPFQGLNRLTNGMSPGELWTIAAASGVGKTAFAIQMSLLLAKCQKNILYITSEVPAEDIYRRAISNISIVSFSKIKKRLGENKFDKDEIDKVIAAGEKLKTDDRMNVAQTNRMDEIEGILRTALARKKVDVLVVDHLQLMQPPVEASKRLSNTYEGYIVNIEKLKEWAQKYGIVVIALSQVNRSKDYRNTGDGITLDSLFGSSAIAMFSDGVIALNRVDGDPYGRINTEVIKCRNGVLGKTVLRFDGVHQRFSEHASDNDMYSDSVASKGKTATLFNA